MEATKSDCLFRVEEKGGLFLLIFRFRAVPFVFIRTSPHFQTDPLGGTDAENRVSRKTPRIYLECFSFFAYTFRPSFL